MQTNLPRTIKIAKVQGHPDAKRVIVDAFLATEEFRSVSMIQFTPSEGDPLVIPMSFADVCNLRTLLEVLQAGHAASFGTPNAGAD